MSAPGSITGAADGAARRLGLLVGVAIGTVLALLELTTDFGGSTITSDPPFAFGIVVAGSVGGWIAGPGAMRARGRGGWLGVIIGLGLMAVLIGDLAVVGTAVAGTALAATNDPATLLMTGPVYAVLGLIVVGPFALPFTMAAAVVWATIMWWLRREAAASAEPSA